MSLVFFTYVVSAIVAKPDWYEVGRNFVRPSFSTDTGYLFTVMALIGTYDRTFMQIYVQSARLKREWTRKSCQVGRADVIIGMTFADIIARLSLYAPPRLFTHMESEISTLPPRQRNHSCRSQEFMRNIYSGSDFLGRRCWQWQVVPLATAYSLSEALGF
jgi:hypothetical protein